MQLINILVFLVASVVAKAATPVQLALNWKAEPQFGGFYEAELGGHFAKNGLDVKILEGSSGTPVVQMVAAGKFDFGIVSADEAVIARSHGADIVALFAAYQTNPQGVLVHEERGFKSVGDVYSGAGTLAIQKGLPYALYLSKKYPKPKVQIVPYLGGITNFVEDKNFSQQCFVTSEPLTAEKKGIKAKSFLVADEGYNPYTTVLVTRDSVLKKNPALVKAMVLAVRAGWRDYIDKPDLTNRKMATLNKAMDLATYKASGDAQKPLIETVESKTNGLGTMTEERWKTLTSQLLDLKLITHAPDAKSLFTNL